MKGKHSARLGSRLLLVGSTGQLGRELGARLPSSQLVRTARQREEGRGRVALDLTKPDDVRSLVRELKPDIIVNAAAYTAVDAAEQDEPTAKVVNELAPAVLAEEALRVGAALIHVSTDYVFDGSGGRPYKEEDPVNPLGVYGRTKWAGEQAIRSHHVPHIILRTAWVYSPFGKNFLRTMLRLGREREDLKVVNDQIGSPTAAGVIAESICELIEKATPQIPDWFEKYGGTYHLCCNGQVSWYGFAQRIFDTARRRGWTFKLRQLEAIPTRDYPTPATRPAYSVLDCSKYEGTFQRRLPPWPWPLEEMISMMEPAQF